MASIAILDYGVGNLFSLSCALRREGANPETIQAVPGSFSFDALILPGVGNFVPVAQRLRTERGKLRTLIARGIPVLGICLGMQLLFDYSEEGEGEGLGFLPGNVRRLPNTVKVPQIGWNRLRPISDSSLLAGLDGEAWVYYVHSFFPEPTDESVVVGRSDYGVSFASVVEKAFLFGTQFHPEKSGDAGARIIRNFLAIARERAG